MQSHAVTQAVGRRLNTAEAWVHAQVGFVGDKVALGEGLLQVLRFPVSYYYIAAPYLDLLTYHVANGRKVG